MADPNKPLIPVDQRPAVLKLRDEGRSVKEIADIYGVSTMSVRRALDASYRGKASKARREAPQIHDRDTGRGGNPIILNDDPKTLTGVLLGDPSPDRLRMIHGREVRG